jgi:hypothetical protein
MELVWCSAVLEGVQSNPNVWAEGPGLVPSSSAEFQQVLHGRSNDYGGSLGYKRTPRQPPSEHQGNIQV